MMFDVYFRIGAVCCGPFTSVAADDAEAIRQVTTLKMELKLPMETVVMLSPSGTRPEWHHHGYVEYLPGLAHDESSQVDMRINQPHRRKLFIDEREQNQ